MSKSRTRCEVVCAIAGWAFFLAVCGHQAWTYGVEWEFGRYGMPVSLVAPDGLHYQNGRELDPLTRYLINAGLQPECNLVLALLLSAAAAYLVRQVRQTYRMEVELFRLRREHELMEQEIEAEQRNRGLT